MHSLLNSHTTVLAQLTKSILRSLPLCTAQWPWSTLSHNHETLIPLPLCFTARLILTHTKGIFLSAFLILFEFKTYANSSAFIIFLFKSSFLVNVLFILLVACLISEAHIILWAKTESSALIKVMNVKYSRLMGVKLSSAKMIVMKIKNIC